MERFPVTLGSDGVLSLVFAATTNLATVSGIEVREPLKLQTPQITCMQQPAEKATGQLLGTSGGGRCHS